MQNHELFAWLRRGAAGHETLRRALEEARPQFEARRVRDLGMTVAPENASADGYLITVTNTGPRMFKDLLVRYEPLLLYAENFGLDTTHMPSNMARVAGEPLIIETLGPGQTAQVARKGFGPPQQFDGPRETVFDVEYREGRKTFTGEDHRWCAVSVHLPNARDD